MVDFKTENLSFSFPDGRCVLKNINLEIPHGQFVLLCGKSGSGKTTLLKMLKPQLSPHGKLEGRLSLFENDCRELSKRDSASKIGFVMQDPELQAVTYSVRSELLFGLECLGVEPSKARLRVAEVASLFSLEKIIDRKISELSGGQKQLVNLASIVAMQPQALLLDEPTAQLDPVSAQKLLDMIINLCREYSITVIITEHRLEKLVSVADRMIVLENGEIISDSAPDEISREVVRKNEYIKASMPLPLRLHSALNLPGKAPLDVAGGRKMLASFFENRQPIFEKKQYPVIEKREKAVEVKNLYYSYDSSEYVLKGVNLSVESGSFFALLGSNGAGKSTLLNLIGGLLESRKGKIKLFSKEIKKYKPAELYSRNVAFLPQSCEALFAGPTIFEDLENILKSENLEKNEIKRAVEESAEFFEIDSLLQSHPYDVSGGELQRCALAAVLLKKPRLILLDEPTKGMDNLFKKKFAEKMKELCRRGATVVMVSHDTEFCAEYCDDCALIFDGVCELQADKTEFFSQNCFYTTAASKMTRGLFENIVSESEVLSLCEKSQSS